MHLVSSSHPLRDDFGHPHHLCHRKDPKCFRRLPEHNGNCLAERSQLTGWRVLRALEEEIFAFVILDEELHQRQLTRRGGWIIRNILENDQQCAVREETGMNSLVSILDWIGDDWVTSNWQDDDDFQNGIRETVYLLPTEKCRQDHRSEKMESSYRNFFHRHRRSIGTLNDQRHFIVQHLTKIFVRQIKCTKNIPFERINPHERWHSYSRKAVSLNRLEIFCSIRRSFSVQKLDSSSSSCSCACARFKRS